MNLLETPIEYLKGVGPQRGDLLRKELGIHKYADLLNLFPNRYIDRTRYYKINELQNSNSEVQIVGKIINIKTVEQGKGKSRLVAIFVDETGQMELVWFQGQKWIRESIKINIPYVIFGKVTQFGATYNMAHPEMELLEEHKASLRSAMQPVYPSTEKLANKGISNKVINKMMQQLFVETQALFSEHLPNYLLNELKLIPKNAALFNIHFPKSQDLLTKAQFRLKFEELFFIQLQLITKNLIRKHKIKGMPFEKVGENFNNFYKNHLPFDLTNAQKRVLKEIRNDLGSNAQMNRLLQGDVGSGKTKTADRKIIHEALEDGTLDILIGTHALLEDKVQFHNLGLAIIDEQHRFGVEQRSKLWKKNDVPPHVLVMTATPIPRTLAMSLYGDLDVSVIDELPPGRKPIQTVHRYDSNRLKVWKFLKDEIEKGRQVYIVYPLIQESEKMDYKDLMDGYESISRDFPLPQYSISIVHGKMKPADKDEEMKRFVEGKTNIMIATTVIEVGVNVPNASVMVIESAERFGLSQLHQLRGRVGRGAEQSYCILMTSHKLSNDSKIRMETMVRTNDGFEISEVDLKLRGPGDIMGKQQSGVLNLQIADLVRDKEMLQLARHHAIKLLKDDAPMEKPEHAKLREAFIELSKKKTIWNYIS